MQGCIKTATQSRCTMQRHKWLSLHRCNGTNGCHCTDATAQMAVDAQMWQPKRLTRHDAKPTEQARRARMHDSGRTESAQGRADPNDRILTNPATLSLTQTGIALLFLVLGANSHGAGKARMPYKMNAQRV